MENLYRTAEEKKSCTVIPIFNKPILPLNYWWGLPSYAQLCIRPEFEKIHSKTDYLVFLKKYRKELEISSNPVKRKCISTVLSKILQMEKFKIKDVQPLKQKPMK